MYNMQLDTFTDATSKVFSEAIDSALSLGILFLFTVLFLWVIRSMWKYYNDQIASKDADLKELSKDLMAVKTSTIEALKDLSAILDQVNVDSKTTKKDIVERVSNAREDIIEKILWLENTLKR